VWDQDFLLSVLPKTYVNTTLKKHRENVLFERQQSMLPATQPYVSRLIRKEKLFVELNNMIKLQKDIKQQIKAMQWRVHRAVAGDDVDGTPTGDSASGSGSNGNDDDNTYVKKCPKDDCKGYLAKRTLKCGICETCVCSKCLQIKENDANGDEHKCNADDVESVKIIAKECKNCPKCSALTYKVDGCSQVWCLSCKTAFNWNTLQVDNGRVHAPDYYAWLRTQNGGAVPREGGDVPCGGVPSAHTVSQFLQKLNGTTKTKCINPHRTELDLIYKMHRAIVHYEWAELPTYRVHENATVFTAHLPLRIEYLRDIITADVFKAKLQQAEKTSRKRASVYGVLQTMVQVGADIIRRLIANNDLTVDNANTALRATVYEMEKLRDYVNMQLLKISEHYGNTLMPCINDAWLRADQKSRVVRTKAAADE
jgi:hypothetical protein